MTQKYIALVICSEIRTVEIVSETAHYVTRVSGNREKKLSEDRAICDSFEEAKLWLLTEKEAELQKVFDEACRIAKQIKDIENLETTSGEW